MMFTNKARFFDFKDLDFRRGFCETYSHSLICEAYPFAVVHNKRLRTSTDWLSV